MRAEAAMSKQPSITTLFARRKRAEARVLRAARRLARVTQGALDEIDQNEVRHVQLLLRVLSARLLDADRAIAAWKREARKRMRAAARRQP